MKRTALAGLFISAVMLASPVFAAEDLCQINLQKINDAVASSGEISSDLQDNIDSTVAQAKEEQSKGTQRRFCTGSGRPATERPGLRPGNLAPWSGGAD